MENNRSCAFTGHRPSRFSFGYDEEDCRCVRLRRIIKEQINTLICAGVTHFYTGMALGVDQWAALAVLELKRQHPEITLTGVRPCDTQAVKWSPEHRERYYGIMSRCDDEYLISYKYTPDCMHKRNRYMVDHADYVLAVYDGSAKGGTAYTVNYAVQKERHIIVIHPDSLTVTQPEDMQALLRRNRLRVISNNQSVKK